MSISNAGNAFGLGDEPTDVTELLKGIIDPEVWGVPILLFPTDGEVSTQNQQFLEILQEFDIQLVVGSTAIDLFDDSVDKEQGLEGE